MSTWKSRIEDLRQAGLTLAEIGEKVGLAASTVSDIEQGRSSSPRGDAALKLHDLHKQICSTPQQRVSEFRA